MDLIFTWYTKDDQQGCFRFSNWLSLWRLGPWMNQLPPAWLSAFRLTFWNKELVCFGVSYIYYCFLPRFTVSSMKLVIFFLLYNIFIYQVLCTLIYRRRSLYSFFLNHCWRYVGNRFHLNMITLQQFEFNKMSFNMSSVQWWRFHSRHSVPIKAFDIQRSPWLWYYHLCNIVATSVLWNTSENYWVTTYWLSTADDQYFPRGL